jgi:hypothetical protein
MIRVAAVLARTDLSRKTPTQMDVKNGVWAGDDARVVLMPVSEQRVVARWQ